MEQKQIIGIVLIIVGLGLAAFGAPTVIDLIGMDPNNPIVKFGLGMSGQSMGGLWLKYGGATLAGVVALLIGIKFTKKQTVKA